MLVYSYDLCNYLLFISSYPPPREKCAGPSFSNPCRYMDSKTKVPLCSLQSYKAIHKKSRLRYYLLLFVVGSNDAGIPPAQLSILYKPCGECLVVNRD